MGCFCCSESLFILRSPASYFSEENAWKYTFVGHSLPVGFLSEVALASVAFHDLPPGRHLHTEVHVQMGTTNSGARKKALLVFLDISKLNFLSSLLVVRVVTPCVWLT